MAKNRYSKKVMISTSKGNQELLTMLAESYMSEVMANDFNHEATDVLNIFERLDKRWREHARGIINRMPKLYPDAKRRTTLTNTFLVMVRKLKDVHNTPIAEMVENEEPFDWKAQPVEKVIEAFKITVPKYNSKARTIKGLQKNYDELEPDQVGIFHKSLIDLVKKH